MGGSIREETHPPRKLKQTQQGMRRGRLLAALAVGNARPGQNSEASCIAYI